MASEFEHSAYRQRVSTWHLASRVLHFAKRPLVMGIVNVTPDSFSDGGRYLGRDAAVEHALRLVEEGADILDIGGESTRPYSTPVGLKDELARVIPVVEQLHARVSVPISIDTTKAEVARQAIAAGAEIVNDISGLEADSRMVPVARDSGAGVCAMHMQGTPATMQDAPRYEDVVLEIHRYLALRRDSLRAAGIANERICLDPGIGFGKTHQHNLTLLANCHRFLDLDCPVLVGHSRKAFIGKVLGNPQLDRMPGTVGVALSLARQGVQIVRVHDVGPVAQALALFEATGGIDGREAILSG